MLLVKNEKGSALIEVMVALVILSIGLIGVSRMSYAVIKGNVRGSHVSKALNLIQAQVELFQDDLSLTNTSVDPLNPDVFSPDIPVPVNSEGLEGQAGSSYRRDWVIKGTAEMKTVIMRIRWFDGGEVRQITSTTMIRL